MSIPTHIQTSPLIRNTYQYNTPITRATAPTTNQETTVTTSIKTSTLTWDRTGPSRWESQAQDGSIWRYCAVSGKTVEVTDLHQPGNEAALDAHASAVEAMDALGSDLDPLGITTVAELIALGGYDDRDALISALATTGRLPRGCVEDRAILDLPALVRDAERLMDPREIRGAL